jgi:hypothetical protein
MPAVKRQSAGLPERPPLFFFPLQPDVAKAAKEQWEMLKALFWEPGDDYYHYKGLVLSLLAECTKEVWPQPAARHNMTISLMNGETRAVFCKDDTPNTPSLFSFLFKIGDDGISVFGLERGICFGKAKLRATNQAADALAKDIKRRAAERTLRNKSIAKRAACALVPCMPAPRVCRTRTQVLKDAIASMAEKSTEKALRKMCISSTLRKPLLVAV